MDQRQRRHIVNNLEELCSSTNCDDLFIAVLMTKEFLGETEIGTLLLTSHPREKARKFYEIAIETVGSYGIIYDLLIETGQNRAVEILSRLQCGSSSSMPNTINKKEIDATKTHFLDVRAPSDGKQQAIKLVTENTLDDILYTYQQLINKTNCDDILIAVLMSYDVLSHEDIAFVKSIENPVKRADMVYGIILSKFQSLNFMRRPLLETNQLGAIELLHVLDEKLSKHRVNENTAADKNISPTLSALDLEKISVAETQLKHIQNNLLRLVGATDCDDTLMAILNSYNVLNEVEIAQLRSIQSKHERAKKLYDIIVLRGDYYKALSEGFTKTNQRRALKILGPVRSVGNSVPNKLSIQFNLCKPTKLFSGRHNELLKLHEFIDNADASQKPATEVSSMVSITGVGSVGKTELCRKYIEMHLDYFDRNVIWINARSADTIQHCLTMVVMNFAPYIIGNLNDDVESSTLVSAFYNFWRDSKCLYVFDNITESSVNFLKDYLSLGTSKTSYIFISQEKILDFVKHEIILKAFDDKEAAEFIAKGLGSNREVEEICLTQLLNCLQRQPLALEQALSHITQRRKVNNYGISEYLKSFECSVAKMSHTGEKLGFSKISVIIATTCDIAVDAVKADNDYGQLAIVLLKLISYEYEEIIPVDTLLFHDGVDEDEVYSALHLLAKFSLIILSDKNICICQFVRDWVQIILEARHRIKFSDSSISTNADERENKTVDKKPEVTSGMKEFQRLYIARHLKKLIENTTCHALLVTYLESRTILGPSDAAELSSIANRHERTQKLYEIIVTRENSYDVFCEALKETNQTGAYEILSILKPIRYDVRQPVHLFTGREEELTKLHENMLMENTSATLITQQASVTGLGGIGKTELCRAYIQRNAEKYEGNVIWIGAENPLQIANTFKTLAKDHLSISLKDADGGDKEITTIVDEVYNYFNGRKSLFVFDNAASSTNKELDQFMPNRVNQRPYILITSRDRDWEQPFNVLALDELKQDEAIEFVKKGLNIEDNFQNEIIKELVTRLQCFPLALQQAISFIYQERSKRNFDIAEYIATFQAQAESLLDYQLSTFLSNKYAKTTFTTWKITTDVISRDLESGNLAITILYMISYLEPDKIPAELLCNHDGLCEDDIHSALQILVKYSMLNCQPTESLFFIHRLVQEVTRINLKKGETEEQTLRNCFLLFKTIDKKSVNHAMSAFYHAQSYEAITISFCHIPEAIVKNLHEDSRYKEGIQFGENSLDVLSLYIPENDIQIMHIEYQLGAMNYYLNNPVESIKRFNNTLMKLKTHPESIENVFYSAQVKSSLCQAFNLKGDTRNFKLVLDDALATFSKYKLPTENANLTNTIRAMEIFRDLEFKQVMGREFSGDYGSVIKSYKSLIIGYKAFYGDSEVFKCIPGRTGYEGLPLALIELAQIYSQMEDLQNALRFSTEAYVIVVDSFEENATFTHVGFQHAYILYQLKKFDEALQIASKVFDCRSKILGLDHEKTLEIQTLIGLCTKKLRKFDNAIEILRKSHLKTLEQFGEQSFQTILSKYGLSEALGESGLHDEGLTMLREVFDQTLKLYGPYHNMTIDCQLRLADILHGLKSYNESLILFHKVKKVIMEKDGDANENMIKINKNIMILLCKLCLLEIGMEDTW